MPGFNGYTVRQVAGGVGRAFIREHHYSRSCHNGPMCWGLFDGEDMIGVLAFATPNSENVRRSVFGAGHENEVTELHRLVLLDGTPTNTESWFIARAMQGLREYRPQIRAVLSFADSTEGHVGTIYQATNAVYTGMTGRATFYRDTEGRLRHPRQNGHSVTRTEAEERGWTPETREAKHRYVFFIGTPAVRRAARQESRLGSQPFPRLVERVAI